MQCARSLSFPATPRQQQPAASAVSVSLCAADVNRLGMRILGLKSISIQAGARLDALLACAAELGRMPQPSVPLLVEELADACATLPSREAIVALRAVFEFQKTPAQSA